jgi:methylated-DNA-protein-cysteine methyltransferase related protein
MDELATSVLAVVRRIPPGRVLTYGDVAALAGGEATARDVGQVLLRHGEQEDVPLLRSEGTPLAPSGAAVDLHAARWSASGRGADAQPSLFD